MMLRASLGSACSLLRLSSSLPSHAWTKAVRAKSSYSNGYGYEIEHSSNLRSTTILSVRKGGKVVMIGDGQVSRGPTVVKGNAVKVRRLREGVVVGMAGAAGDCLTLIERLERALDETAGNLLRACVSLAKAWRTEKYLRHLDAVICVADADHSLMVSGNGDVIQPEDGIMSVGSGGIYALSAARALIDIEGMDAETIARKSMKIAADICVYTNHNTLIEILDVPDKKMKEDA